MNTSVRVRYAPSPTGLPHVGNIRTALFNWLFARHYGGAFILRIEDTDVTRKVEGADESILSSLRWLGLDWDEGPEKGGPYGPYFQSQRLDIYKKFARRLLDEEKAYHCYCSPERLEEMRADQVKRKKPPGYDRRCRNLSVAEREELAKEITSVVRFKTPTEGQTTFNDLIRGDITFENRTLDDFVLIKSDGYPTYHMANIVDDHLMKISHVLRADEWLASTPRHVLLYAAFGIAPPFFAHLPMILGEDRSKLSKRHGATAITEYQEMGYLPEAMINFLALLGWSLDEKTELFSREALIRNFSIERIGKTGAIFSLKKLEWMNGVYIRKLSPFEFAERALPFLEKGLDKNIERPLPVDYVMKIAPLIQERTRTLKEAVELSSFFFQEELEYSVSLFPHLPVGKATLALQKVKKVMEEISDFSDFNLENTFRSLAEELELKTGDFFGLLRIAFTGRKAAPPLFQTMTVLGRERCMKRLADAIRKLEQPV